MTDRAYNYNYGMSLLSAYNLIHNEDNNFENCYYLPIENGNNEKYKQIKKIDEKTMKQRIDYFLCDLNDNQRFVIHHRLGLFCEKFTLQQCAKILGVTIERIRQIESTALFKLRQKVRSSYYEEGINV